jgi:ubiquinone/menaquinone biosynthesis C-methylase UbiE
MGEAGRAFVQAHWRRELFTPLFRRALLAVTDPASEPFRERELARIRGVYGYYDATPREQRKRNMSNPGTRAHADSRWAAIREELLRQPPQRGAAILDVGCGGGADLARLAQLFNGSRPELHGVDVLPDRIERAREAVPEASFMLEPADQLPFADDHFHVILASTLFSSLVDDAYACSVAAELIRVLEPGGRLVCYDVRYPNPTNPHTRAMSHRRLRRLFPEPLVLERLQSVTLLPPLARRLGRLTRIAYAPLHRIPPLRSHYLAVVTKPEASPTMVNSA